MSRSDAELYLIETVYPASIGILHRLMSEKCLAYQDLIQCLVKEDTSNARWVVIFHQFKESHNQTLEINDKLGIFSIYFDEVVAYKSKLEGMSMQELREEYDRVAWFSKEECKLDNIYWSSIVLLSPDEVVALSFGRDPRKVNARALQKGAYNLEFSAFVASYFDRLRQVERFAESKGTEKLKKRDIFVYFSQLNIDSDFLVNRADEATSDDDKLDTRERYKLYMIVLSMAIKHYGFQPTAAFKDNKNDIYKKIAEDVRAIGFKIDEKTVKNHIKLSHEYSLSGEPPFSE